MAQTGGAIPRRFIVPPNQAELMRRKMEAEARAYVERCVRETGFLPKEEMMLRVDPGYAAAVEAESRRIYNQAMLEISTRKAREEALQRKIADEIRRAAKMAKLGEVLALVSRHLVEDTRQSGFPSQAAHDVERTLASLAQSFRLANEIATRFRWPLIWNHEKVMAALRPRVSNLIVKGATILKQSAALTEQGLRDFVQVLCDPEVSAEDTRRALDQFLHENFKGYPPPQDLYTKALEFTSAKSLWLARRRLFRPGADSTAQGQKIPDFVSPFGPGDNVKTAGITDTPTQQNILEKNFPRRLVVTPEDMAANAGLSRAVEAAYESVMKDIGTKVRKYQKDGRVIVTIDASMAPWMDAAELRRRIAASGLGPLLAAVFLMKSGRIEDAWP